MRFTYSKRKMAKLFANSGDPDQTPHSALPFWRGCPDYSGLTPYHTVLKKKTVDFTTCWCVYDIAEWVANSVDPDQTLSQTCT